MTAKQVLLGAAKRIETEGWVQGQYAKTKFGVPGGQKMRPVPAGSPCRADQLIEVAETDVIGAIRQAGKRAPDGGDAAKAKLLKFLGVDNLAEWNDEPDRTKTQVIAALNGAASA